MPPAQQPRAGKRGRSTTTPGMPKPARKKPRALTAAAGAAAAGGSGSAGAGGDGGGQRAEQEQKAGRSPVQGAASPSQQHRRLKMKLSGRRPQHEQQQQGMEEPSDGVTSPRAPSRSRQQGAIKQAAQAQKHVEGHPSNKSSSSAVGFGGTGAAAGGSVTQHCSMAARDASTLAAAAAGAGAMGPTAYPEDYVRQCYYGVPGSFAAAASGPTAHHHWSPFAAVQEGVGALR